MQNPFSNKATQPCYCVSLWVTNSPEGICNKLVLISDLKTVPLWSAKKTKNNVRTCLDTTLLLSWFVMKAKQWCHLTRTHCGNFDTWHTWWAGPDRIGSLFFFFFLCADFKGKLFWILYQNEPNMHSVGMWVTGCMMNLVLRKCIELSLEFCGHKFHVGLMIILTEPLNVLGPLHTREAFVE